MTRKLLIIALGALAAISNLMLPGQASAYECLGSGCPKWCDLPVPYGITITSVDIGDDTTVAEVRRGMDDWTGRSCTGLQTNYTGRSGAVAGAGDNQSVIGWVESGWRYGSSAIGVTGPRWVTGREICIVEADMEMNGVNFTWTTGPGSRNNVNTYSIALHEGGHYYGLGHSADPNAAMYFQYSGGIDEIGSDDEAGICALYPGSGGSGSDCTVTGCPSGQECVSGACQTIVGDGTVCATCESNADCGGANDLCLRYPDGIARCGKFCSSPADCDGANQACAQLDPTTTQCIGIMGSTIFCPDTVPQPDCTFDADCADTERCNEGTCEPRPTNLLGLGEMCDDNAQCSSGVCSIAAGGRCSQLCDGFHTTSCPSGFYCDGEATGTCGDGLCLAGTAGAAAIGDACSEDTDCASLMCNQGACASPCQIGGATTCDAGLSCQTTGIVGCGACKPEGSLAELGQPCETGVDCRSGECARSGDTTFCTQICEDESGCPTGFACVPAGDIALCIAAPGSTGRTDDGCGCSAVGSERPLGAPLSLAGLALGFLFWRRRR